MNGGISAVWPDKTIDAYRFPIKIKKLNGIVSSIRNHCDIEGFKPYWMIEKVHAFSGSSPKGTFTFGKNLGIWEGTLLSNNISWIEVHPKDWQAEYKLDVQGKERKNKLKDISQKYVNRSKTKFNVTFATADAILIAKFYKKKGVNYGMVRI